MEFLRGLLGSGLPGTYHSEAHLGCDGVNEAEGKDCDHMELEPEEDIEGKQGKGRADRANDWGLDMTAAGDGRRAEGDRAEAGVAATAGRDNPIGVVVLEVPEDREGREDST